MGVPGVKRPTLAVAAARLARTGDLAGFREREGGGIATSKLAITRRTWCHET